MKQMRPLPALTNKIVYLLILIIISCYKPGTLHDSSVALTVLTHGTHKLLTCTLNTDSISIIKHSTNNEPDTTIISRKLTSSEKEIVHTLIKTIPLDSLKDSYINKQVEGEIHREFDIRIGSRRKKITVYYMKVEPLEKISNTINSFAELVY